MGARHPRELRAWRHCHDVRLALLPILRRPAWQHEIELRSQIRRAIRSACSNAAEGFYRFRHREFAHFVKISRASLGEVIDHLIEARELNLVTSDEAQALDELAGTAMSSLTALHRYLRNTPDPPDRDDGSDVSRN